MQKFCLFAALALAMFSCSVENYDNSRAGEHIDSPSANYTLDVLPMLTQTATPNAPNDDNSANLKEFYAQRNYCTYWFGSEKPTNQLITLQKTVEEFASEGSAIYSGLSDSITNLVTDIYEVGKADSTAIARADLKVSQQFARFSKNLLEGQLETYSNGKAQWYVEQGERNVLKDLASIQNAMQLDSLLHFYRPRIVEYTNLLKAFQTIESSTDTLTFHFSCDHLDWDSLAKDSMNERLASRLGQWGLTFEENLNSVEEEEMSKALAQFQVLRGLEDTGQLDCQTAELLNMSREEVLDKIALNLERLKTLPRRVGKEYIMVNIPEYKLRIFRDGKPSFETRVIVGKEYNPTPIFIDTLSYLVFSPTWTVPQSIIQNEMIPNLQKDSRHYLKKNFIAYEGGEEINQAKMDWNNEDIASRYFIFVQQPGPSNALGLVKFIMPNDLSIYLHDTPSDYLFDRTERTLSHGCVRLEKPKELAEYILKDSEDWDQEKIGEAMRSDEPIKVFPKRKLPVEIVYLTARVNEAGHLAIFPDVYGHDKEQAKLLSGLIE